MSARRPHRRRSFTPEQANATLPLVRAITRDLVRLSHEVTDRRRRLDSVFGRRSPDAGSVYREELDQVDRELERDARRLLEYVEELRQLGVEPKSATDGLIDFPAVLDGRSVYLCWKLGEPEVLYWHERNGGFRGRQPLPPAWQAKASRPTGVGNASPDA